MAKPALLLVDDQLQNLVALEAILEPLGHELVTARSGREVLKILLTRDDFAVILLDVRMPDLDGFELAKLIKQRERTGSIPIIFLTAFSTGEQQVYRGYEVGAVDYVFKPFEPEILRAKVSVFIELWEKNRQIREQAERLAEQEVAELRRASAERYRELADAMPQIVWTSDSTGAATYYNRRWFEYTGKSEAEEGPDMWLDVTHPDDLGAASERRSQTLVDGETFEVEYRLRAADGTYRWHLGRAVPSHADDGTIEFWIGTATDIDDRKRIEEAQHFLLDAGAELSVSLDWHVGLRAVAKLAVPRVADLCLIELRNDDGTTWLPAAEYAGPGQAELVKMLEASEGSTPGSASPLLIADTHKDPLAGVDSRHLQLIRELELKSYICVPITARRRVLGTIILATAGSSRRFSELDLRTVEELVDRIAAGAERARLYEEVERRARASRALETIAEGVVLLDSEERVLLWNAAAEAITGIAAADIVGWPARDAIRDYMDEASVGEADGRPQTVPIDIGGRELWLSFSAVRFDEGTVYTFRDVTEERGVERMRSDFIATVSHELRTPVAAIYGASATLRRTDIELDEETRGRLLDMVATECDRLTQTVSDVLLASHLDSDQLQLKVGKVDAMKVTEQVVEAARTHLPEGVTLTLRTRNELPPVAADEQQLRQVLSNLVENAVKYSPEGGPVNVEVSGGERAVRFAVADEGLGVPPSERQRIFEKFYRLDPNMTRGVGGTGLGLYICRELVRRLEGRIWVEPNNDKGSTFVVELPIAAGSLEPVGSVS